MPPRRWTTLASERLIERWWMTLRRDRVRLPTGHVIDEYHVLEYPDWSCVLPLTASGEVVLVEQYRYGIDRLCLELPAGAIDPGETPADAARRELREEAGYTSERWEALGRLAVEPGRHTNWGYVFLAFDVEEVGVPHLDPAEDLRVRPVPIGDLMHLIADEQIVHGVHVAAILRAIQSDWGAKPLR